ncbi:hypothetical protein M422DRAFT_186667, partial [Sphaerobolus stellatus SS14]
YLQLRMHMRAVKMCIRKKLVEQKFERTYLEKAYQQQIVCDKDHQKTKKLFKQTFQTISTLVSCFNHLVQDLHNVKKRGGIPCGMDVPQRLNTQELYRLDVDDPIWIDVMEDDKEGQSPPRWLSDNAVRSRFQLCWSRIE